MSGTGGTTVYWTNWTSDTVGTTTGMAVGTIVTPAISITVSYSGEVVSQTVVNGTSSTGYPSWGPSSTYADGTVVPDAPTYHDLIAQAGGAGSGVNTITFSTPITNPVMSIWSLGQPDKSANYTFTNSEPFTIIAGGPSTEFGGSGLVANQNSVTGNEGNGTIQFIGTYSQITFTNTLLESYFGFTLGAVAQTSDGGSPPCFCRGTLILTSEGQVAVEALRVGDDVVTLNGDARPIRWIGRRSYDGRFLRNNPKAQPVRFRAESLAPGLPSRDLLVSPNHAMFIGGVLIQAECLINGHSIVRATEFQRVDYFHLELDTHDIILAEGAPSETFVDDGCRGIFHNAAEFSAMYPDAGAPAAYCARRIDGGPELDAVRRRLDTGAIQEIEVNGPGLCHAQIRDGVVGVRLMTKSGYVPGDRRRLGGAVTRVSVDGRVIPLNECRLTSGWHQIEAGSRWTDGAALVLVPGGRSIEVEFTSTPFADPGLQHRRMTARPAKRIRALSVQNGS